ncbi:MAG: glycoside hydrolase family 127 protein, partial [Hespellia sp.]|nr:glycoside hydrolase family 127 protein [Hespellia sp.]
SDIQTRLDCGEVTLKMSADYPSNGSIHVGVHPSKSGSYFKVALRKPGFSREFQIKVNGEAAAYTFEKGYIYLERSWQDGDQIELELDVSYRFVRCNPMVADNIGKVSLMKGPWVYCLEEADNGRHLASIMIDTEKEAEEVVDKELFHGTMCAKLYGKRIAYPEQEAGLYMEEKPSYVEDTLKAIPYCCWNNRGRGEMLVWMREQ